MSAVSASISPSASAFSISSNVVGAPPSSLTTSATPSSSAIVALAGFDSLTSSDSSAASVAVDRHADLGGRVAGQISAVPEAEVVVGCVLSSAAAQLTIVGFMDGSDRRW
jgi:hypothetical protein